MNYKDIINDIKSFGSWVCGAGAFLYDRNDSKLLSAIN